MRLGEPTSLVPRQPVRVPVVLSVGLHHPHPPLPLLVRILPPLWASLILPPPLRSRLVGGEGARLPHLSRYHHRRCLRARCRRFCHPRSWRVVPTRRVQFLSPPTGGPTLALVGVTPPTTLTTAGPPPGSGPPEGNPIVQTIGGPPGTGIPEGNPVASAIGGPPGTGHRDPGSEPDG